MKISQRVGMLVDLPMTPTQHQAFGKLVVRQLFHEDKLTSFQVFHILMAIDPSITPDGIERLLEV